MRFRSVLPAIIISLVLISFVFFLWAQKNKPASFEGIKIITGSANHRIQMPTGVAVNRQGNVYITNLENAKILIFNPSGDYIGEIGKKGAGQGQFGLPWDVVIDSRDNIYVVDLAFHRVQKFDADHNFVLEFGAKGDAEGQFDTPFALAVDKQDNIYVLDTGNSRVQVFNSNGKFVRMFGEPGNAEGQFIKPSDLAVAPDGRIFVVDFDNARVQIFDSSGRFLTKFGQAGSMFGDLAQPKGIAIDRHGIVYVNDVATNLVNVFNPKGDFLFRFGGPGAKPGRFRNPGKSCVDKDGKLYIADSQNNRVQVMIPIYHQGDYKSDECLTSCHQDVDPEEFSQKYPHVPVDSYGSCDLCHRLENALGILGVGNIDRAEVCVDCHAGKTASRYVHGPVGTGECGDCHKAHGSKYPRMLFENKEEVCYYCHPDDDFVQRKFIHDPLAKGNCVKCHDPHGSEEKFFMRKPTLEICLECHGQFKFPEDEYVHGPVAGGDCDACHDPHSADNASLLRKEGNALCFICHSESIIAKKNVHQPLIENGSNHKTSCLICHTPHQSRSKFKLRTGPDKLCFTADCHDDQQADFSKPYKHGPMRDADCSTCHSPHSSNGNFLLKFDYPKEKNNKFTESLYELCFQCHLRSLVTEKLTTEKTNFRNGNKNLHYVHVVQKGRNCDLCHDIHSSNNELLVREFDMYPKDSLAKANINKFKLVVNSNGGTCEQNNCHAGHLSYSRLKAR